MICYFDTSAIIKKYLLEKGTREVLKYWRESEITATSVVAYAETVASFQRKIRETAAALQTIHIASQRFRNDWSKILRVAVSDQINDLIKGLVTRHPLRGFDAIHLASALWLREALGEDIIFLCADAKLIAAGRDEGLLIPPEPLG